MESGQLLQQVSPKQSVTQHNKTSLLAPLTVWCECSGLVSSFPPCGDPGPFHLVALPSLGIQSPLNPAIRPGDSSKTRYVPFLIVSAQGWPTACVLTFYRQEQPPAEGGPDTQALCTRPSVPFRLLFFLYPLNSYASFKALPIFQIPPLL